MGARVVKLEDFAAEARDRLTRMEMRLEQTVTKNDLSEAMNAQIKWVVGTALVVGGVAVTVMTFVLNNAVPRTPAAAAAPPIVINVPVPAAAAPPPATKQ